MARLVPGAVIDSAFDALYARLFAANKPSVPAANVSLATPSPSLPQAAPPVPRPAPTPPPPIPSSPPPRIDRAALRLHLKELLSADENTKVTRSAIKHQLSTRHGYDFSSDENDAILRNLVDEVVAELNAESEPNPSDNGAPPDDSSLTSSAAAVPLSSSTHSLAASSERVQTAPKPAKAVPKPTPSKASAALQASVETEDGNVPTKLPSACAVCKKRHVACDLKVPCGQCKLRGTVSQCSPWTATKRPSSEASATESKKLKPADATKGGGPKASTGTKTETKPEVKGEAEKKRSATSSPKSETKGEKKAKPSAEDGTKVQVKSSGVSDGKRKADQHDSNKGKSADKVAKEEKKKESSESKAPSTPSKLDSKSESKRIDKEKEKKTDNEKEKKEKEKKEKEKKEAKETKTKKEKGSKAATSVKSPESNKVTPKEKTKGKEKESATKDGTNKDKKKEVFTTPKEAASREKKKESTATSNDSKEKPAKKDTSKKIASPPAAGPQKPIFHGPPRLLHLKPDTESCTQLLVYRPNPSRPRPALRFTYYGSMYTTEALPALQASVMTTTLAELWRLHAERQRSSWRPSRPSGVVFLRRNTTRRPAPAYLDGDTDFYTAPSRVNRAKNR